MSPPAPFPGRFGRALRRLVPRLGGGPIACEHHNRGLTRLDERLGLAGLETISERLEASARRLRPGGCFVLEIDHREAGDDADLPRFRILGPDGTLPATAYLDRRGVVVREGGPSVFALPAGPVRSSTSDFASPRPWPLGRSAPAPGAAGARSALPWEPGAPENAIAADDTRRATVAGGYGNEGCELRLWGRLPGRTWPPRQAERKSGTRGAPAAALPDRRSGQNGNRFPNWGTSEVGTVPEPGGTALASARRMPTWRLPLLLFDGRVQVIHGEEDSLRVLREILVQLMSQHSEAIISHMEGGRPQLIVVPELDRIGEVAPEAEPPE